MKIETEEQALDTILELVRVTEDDFESALAATVTIWRLYERDYSDLALAVLETYRPNAMKRPWAGDN